VLGMTAGDTARELLTRRKIEKMPIEQIAWLLPSALDNKPTLKLKQRAIFDLIQSRVVTTGSTAHFVTSSTTSSSSVFLHSDVRHDAAILGALLETDPKNGLITKMVRGLMDQRKNGRWYNTQDNTFALLAMHKYFTTQESIVPSFLADLWVGGGHAGQKEFSGYSTDVHSVSAPMSHLVKEDNSVTIGKSGQGRLYYRISIDYSPKELFMPPRDCGFNVSRSYHAVNDTTDVVLDSDELGHKRCVIKAGAQVLIKVVMVASSARSHVALVDYLPGGLEPQNTSAHHSGTNTGFSYWRRFWSHQNIRDSRVEVFVDHLYPGLYTYSYVVKAITKGKFIVPPAKAEEMYSPDVYGRSEMMVVHVE